MSRRPKWNGASKEAQKFKDLCVLGDIKLDMAPKDVWENHQDILGKYSVKQVENAMVRLGETELGKRLKSKQNQGKVDCCLFL